MNPTLYDSPRALGIWGMTDIVKYGVLFHEVCEETVSLRNLVKTKVSWYFVYPPTTVESRFYENNL